ncbi:tRNA dihydrouridine synthase [Campylobacter sp. MG1]|uniref:tRNA dihydrouridine synthase n=1 Tax=Campylobacter sp. MG1 TaxID=2976332 RepID=UPI00226C8901|nr:tRNA-dihydrouridine synthase [Campylobacter sp. MG1]
MLTNLFSNSKPLFLAPMAGLSDLAFRTLVKDYDCDVTISEMISSNALVYESEKSFKMLEKSHNENPFITQIAGSNPEIIKKAVDIINTKENIHGIDFNCGCPVNKVIKQHAGSSLLKDLDHLKRLLEIIKKNNKTGTTSVKIRIGFDECEIEKIILALNELELDFISIHGRTRKGMYSAKVDYNAIGLAKSLSKTKIIANGDISYENHKEVLKITNADGLMIGRNAIGNPWIFSQIKNKNKEINKSKIILHHFELMCNLYGEFACSIFRKHLHEYSKCSPNASNFRDEVNRINNHTKMQNIIEEFFQCKN